jgi:lipopolysaccharide/colanic/teichoic acid biosynthesis glycosyltransferase
LFPPCEVRADYYVKILPSGTVVLNTEYENIIGNCAFRHHVKPGVTGWAQVNGMRGETQTVDLMAKRVELDLWYINNWSLWLDFKILLRTLFLGLQSAAY